MEKARVTPKDFVLWLGAMIALYACVVAFISLVFDYINHAFPNPVNANYYIDPYSSGISYQMAALIVLTPLFLFLMRLIRRDIARDPSRSEIWVRRWALFLTLFLAGATLVVDLIVLINTFLQGEDLTTAFLLKVLTVFLVSGLGFMHFLADLRGYWEREPDRARAVNWAVGVLVLFTIIAGFFIIGTPQEIRAKKQDAQRVSNLITIQWQVVNYWQQKQKLPTTLADLNDPITNNQIPLDPQTKQPYEYTTTGARSFQLCATFAGSGNAQGFPPEVAMMPVAPASAVDGKAISDNWQHAAGRVCFDRTIDAQRYPPYPKGR